MPGQSDWLGHKDSYPAWAHAEKHGIPVCLQMTMQGLPVLRALLERFPKCAVLLDHCARPDLRTGPPYGRASACSTWPPFPGVHLKLTNRTLAAAAEGNSDPAGFPGAVVTSFGAERIAWGSNFPAAEGSLAELVTTAARRAVAACPTTQQATDLRRHRARTSIRHLAGSMPEQPVHLHTVLETIAADHAAEERRVPTIRLVARFLGRSTRSTRPLRRWCASEAYDISELAIVTALQAIAFERPVMLLPVVVASRFQRGCLISHRPHGVSTRTTGAASTSACAPYTQTTGMWVRAHLDEDYGLADDRHSLDHP